MEPPLCSSRECIKALEQAGFVHARTKGSHCIMRKTTDERTYVVVVVLNRRQIPRGTMRDIIQQAGMTIEEFAALLK